MTLFTLMYHMARAQAPRGSYGALLRLSPGGEKCVTLALPSLPTYGNAETLEWGRGCLSFPQAPPLTFLFFSGGGG